ncbi:Transcriptional regulator, PbsX family [Pseudomonas chlororaphis]|jgi:transcriptional regulator with XRE-family HTH domain|uniref:Transcriptional regulator, PbsX family n=1 Tax=Pseudomonas chlororaphis TaxID=587753 RepID=A0A3G7TMY4_9PSED|nr:helix-turn-helix transcriptional regulator [Pseudomonas chlororaphis]AZE47742.1 Transcriptional regulator, PbsX family [Pseudomonas chlororaphis]
MNLNAAFAQALKKLRTRRGLTQERFALATSTSYMSQLERGLKNPTLEKVEHLAAIMDIHPASLLIQCYLERSSCEDIELLFEKIRFDLAP